MLRKCHFRQNFLIRQQVAVELQWVRGDSQWSRKDFAVKCLANPANHGEFIATLLRLQKSFESIQNFLVFGEPVATPRRMKKMHGDSKANAERLQCECRATGLNEKYTIRSRVAIKFAKT